jgi:hypothetical protein
MSDIFQHWLPLRRLSVDDLPRFGDFPAVYALRETTTKGILKFGNTDRLRRRIFGNYLGGVGGDTTQRIHAQLFGNDMIDRIEFAWFETKDKAEAESKEREFRDAYKRANGKRPAWDLIG